MQSKSTFPARIAPVSVLELLPFSGVGLRKARFEREMWTCFASITDKNISGESVTSRENGAPQESKKVVLEVLDLFTEKLLGESRGPERVFLGKYSFSLIARYRRPDLGTPSLDEDSETTDIPGAADLQASGATTVTPPHRAVPTAALSRAAAPTSAARRQKLRRDSRHRYHHKCRDHSPQGAPFTTFIPTSPKREARYQCIICQLFATYGPAAALKYDRHFRQAAAWLKKDHPLHWDALKDDLLVWCVTNPPIGARQQTTPFPRHGAPAPPGGSAAGSPSLSVLHPSWQGDLPPFQRWKMSQRCRLHLSSQVLGPQLWGNPFCQHLPS
ncbi:hypothetical protein EMCRGX_G003200 [Ephydatia muelleri]